MMVVTAFVLEKIARCTEAVPALVPATETKLPFKNTLVVLPVTAVLFPSISNLGAV